MSGRRLPPAIDLLSRNRVVFEPNLLPDPIKQLGLVIHVVFAFEGVAFRANNFKPDKDLTEDKERCATAMSRNC